MLSRRSACFWNSSFCFSLLLILLITLGLAPRAGLSAAILQNRQNNTESNSDETGRINPDLPHLPEASTAVGKGRVVLEGGYTLNDRSASSFSAQGNPEALLRIGVLTDWFELRVGQNFLRQQNTISGVTSRISGAQDLYLAVKFAVIKQKEISARNRSDSTDDGPDR